MTEGLRGKNEEAAEIFHGKKNGETTEGEALY